jgi:predicted transcriptional regulator of viral defense system
MDDDSRSEQILRLVEALGVLRPKDLVPHGIQAEYLRRLCDRGAIKKIGRGSYVPAQTRVDPALRLAVVARAVPHGVICLESALAVHGLGTAPTGAVDLAIELRAARPRLDQPSLRVFRLGGEPFTAGVETHRLGQVDVPVYDLEKTLTDLFKFRNKIGPHRAVDALRAALRGRRVRLDALWHYARLGRVERVMRPYVDALAPALH